MGNRKENKWLILRLALVVLLLKLVKVQKNALTETRVERQKAWGVNTSNAYY